MRFASIHLILAIIAHLDFELYHGELDKEIYMDQPIGFEAKGQERKVFKFHCSIYGLKQ